MPRLLLLLIAAWLVSGFQAPPPPNPTPIADSSPERQALNARVYDVAVARVRARFVDRTFNGVDFVGEAARRRDAAVAQPTEREFYIALNQLLDLLDDDHTGAWPPARVAVRAESTIANLGRGVGLWLYGDTPPGERASHSFVHHVTPGGPADGLGIESGWWIKTVDGGPPSSPQGFVLGQDYVFGFVDLQGRDQFRTIRFAEYPREYGYIERRPDGVAVITVPEFDRMTSLWLAERLREFRLDPPTAVILDLRLTPGGRTEAADDMLSHFFTRPFRFARVRARLQDRLLFSFYDALPERVTPSATPWTGPLVVLQSSGTASGGEVIAGALQDCGRALIVGETTIGGTRFSNPFLLPDGGLLGIGMGEYRRWDDHPLEKVGVEPDIRVSRQALDRAAGQDSMMLAAARLAPTAPHGGRCRRSQRVAR